MTPIEVKASKKINSHDITNMKHYLNASGLRRGIVMCLERPRSVKVDALEIDIVPIYADLVY
jgi:hypothetical protein